jgi:hypothetical protein
MFMYCMKRAQQIRGREAGSPEAASSRNVTTLYVFANHFKLIARYREPGKGRVTPNIHCIPARNSEPLLLYRSLCG